MQEKVYFIFFIFCAILSQEILAKLLEDNVGESSKFLVRQKRVIDRSLGGETPLISGNIPYILNIKRYSRLHCTGSILSRNTGITAARCVVQDLWMYKVQSGSAYSHRGNEHNITEKRIHGHNPSRSNIFLNGIALINVHPPFTFSSTTGSIGLHSAPVLEDMFGNVFGWGTHVYSGPVETAYPKRLRFITVPIMNHRNCQDIYRNQFPITDEDVCTHHPQKLCGKTDAGAPLVINNQLAGVHIGEVLPTGTECAITPDVFILVQHANYGPWIARNIIN